MQSLVLLFGLFCLASINAIRLDLNNGELPPRIKELMAPYLDSPIHKSLINSLDPANSHFRTTSEKQERALHLLLDGIVREVNANLKNVDDSFEKQKEAVREVRNLRYKELAAETQTAINEQGRLETSLSNAERNKINSDNSYDEALGQSKQQKMRVVRLKEKERTGKIAANTLYNQRYLEIDAEHNESRQQYVDELMFVAKLRQMIEQLNVEYKHQKGGGKTSSPTISPTPAPTSPTPSPTRAPTAAPTLMENLDGTSGWRLVAQEAAHHQGLLINLGKHFGYFNSPSFNLGPTYKFPRDYTEVAITWGGKANFVHFIASEDFFDDSVIKTLPVWHVEASTNTGSFVGGAGSFCRAAAIDGNHRQAPGGASWAIVPSSNSQRDCGCSGSDNSGSGLFYGGTPSDCTECQCHGGGFTGFSGDGQPKTDVVLNKEVQIWVRLGNWRVLSGCESNEEGNKVWKNSASKTARPYTATAVSADAVLGVTAKATSTSQHSLVGLTLLEQGGVNRKGPIVPNWGIEFGPAGVATLYNLAGALHSDQLDIHKDIVLGDKVLTYQIGDTATVTLENGYVKVYLNGNLVHTFYTKINLLHESLRAQFSFQENSASVDSIKLSKMGHWTAYEKKCQGNNANCALKTQEECVSQCVDNKSCRMYMYNEVTGGCCIEQCFPPAYVPASPMPEVAICDAWMDDCSQDGGWDSYVKEYSKA